MLRFSGCNVLKLMIGEFCLGFKVLRFLVVADDFALFWIDLYGCCSVGSVSCFLGFLRLDYLGLEVS